MAESLKLSSEHHNINNIELAGLETKRSDERDLARLGKKAVLKRNFGFMSIVGFSSTVLVTWEAFLILFATGFTNGGPAGVIYGFLFVWVGTLAVYSTLAEAASMAPTSGGQYHWVSMLSPPEQHKFLSYITGWLTVLGWQCTVASVANFAGTLIQGVIIFTDVGYNPQAWHAVMLYWAILIVGVIVNTFTSHYLPKIEALILILHVLGFFSILLPLIFLGTHVQPSAVFETFINDGNWPTQGLSFFVGLLGNAYVFFGVDGAMHMSEEIQHAAIVVPRAVVLTVFLNGAMGLGIALALLFSIEDIDAALNTKTKFPFIEIFYQAVQSVNGAAVMAAIVFFMAFFSIFAVMAAASRQLWAFSRDRAVPWWQQLQRVNSKSAIPVFAVTTTTAISCLLALINLGSSTAFSDIVSLSVVGLFGSYIITVVLLLWRRIRGDIKPHGSMAIGVHTNIAGEPLTWGPWHIPGVFGIFTNSFAVVYLIIVFFFVNWPPVSAPTPATMNYSSLMFGVTMIFSVLYYVFWARKTYTGPVIEVNL